MPRPALLSIFVLCLAAAPAEAAAVRYEVYWGGFHAAEAHLDREDGPDGVHTRLGVQTMGLAEELSGLVLDVEAWAQASGSDLAPGRFLADSQGRTKGDRLTVEFAPAAPARIVSDEHRGPPDDDPPPPVPAELTAGTLDPLTALLDLGRRAAEAAENRGPARFVLPVYDGHRRYDAQVTVEGPGSATVRDRTLSGIAVEVRLDPVAGFKPKRVEFWKQARFIALIDPASGLPLRITSQDTDIATVITAEEPLQR